MGRTLVWVGLGIFCIALLLVALLSHGGARGTMTTAQRKVPPTAVPIGVMGDSDSSSYQGDSDPKEPYHRSRLQWTEVLARMRSNQVDLGEWGTWGVPRWMSLARVRDGLGLRWRGPRRTEYRHDVAWSSPCWALMEGGWRQAERLADIMDEEPERWKRGIVIVRVGINDFGKEPLLMLRDDPAAPEVRARMDKCLSYLRGAIDLIHGRHPEARFLLIGTFDNVHWPRYFPDFSTQTALRNVAQGLDYYDNQLRAMAAADKRLAFFDDRAWFTSHWGGRDAEGRPAYKTIQIGKLTVSNSEGDRPDNALLDGGHAGMAWNVLWAQSLVQQLRESFGAPIDPITDAEMAAFVDARLP